MIPVNRRLEAPAAAVWRALTDIRAWPEWGPSVTAARLDGGGHRLRDGSSGRVQTVLGVWVPFRVTEWEEGRRWAWSVAGVPATSHGVEAADGTGASEATIGVPLWAPAYVPLCWVGLGRLERVARRFASSPPG